jgi:hypothetical protein
MKDLLAGDKCLVCGKRGAKPRILIPLAVYCDSCAKRRYEALTRQKGGVRYGR